MTWGEWRASTHEQLRGCRVLVVDDDPVIALDLELLLTDAGAAVVGPVTTVAEGSFLALSETLSAAVLDVRLGDETVGPVAAILAERDVPIVFYSGQLETDTVLRRWSKAIFLAKPTPGSTLVAALRALIDHDETRVAGRPVAAHPGL